jgi:hypothetical protein
MPARITVSDRARKRAAGSASALASIVILLGLLIMFWPGVPGNLHYMLRKRHQATFVANSLANEASLKITTFTLRPRQRACMSSVTVTPSTGLAVFELSPAAGAVVPRPALALDLKATGYRSVSHLAAGGYYKPAVFHLEPPPQFVVIATACLINIGRTPLFPEGTTDPLTTSRSALTIDGKPVAGDISLSFLGKRRIALAENVGEILGHIANLTDQLVPVWLVGILILSALVGVPIGIVVAFHRSLRDEEVAEGP